MLGDDDQHESEKLLKFNEGVSALVKHRNAFPKYSIMKARVLTGNS